MQFFYAGFSYFPLSMLARSLDNPYYWIGNPVGGSTVAPVFALPFGGSQLEYAGAWLKLAPNFPYGYDVEPDHP